MFRELLDRSQVRTQAPLISVGNLLMGGAGKTPMMDFLVSLLGRDFRHIAALHRTYRSEVSKISEVTEINPAYFGDEPTWIKYKHPGVRVFVGPSKSSLAKNVDQLYRPSLILLDDGFSHRRLERDLDLLLIDASRPLRHYRMFPLGWAREPRSSLERADIGVFTRFDQADPETVRAFRSAMPFFHSQVLWGDLISLQGEVQTLAHLQRVSAFSGLAHNQGFAQQVAQQYSLERFVSFGDHYKYQEVHIEALLASRPGPWLTTEKDWIKLTQLRLSEKNRHRIWAVRMHLKFKETHDEIRERVLGYLQK